MWMVSAEVARHRTHDVIAGFGVTLHSDPWPMFAHIPVAVALVPVLVLLLRVAIWRSHIQANLNAGARFTVAPTPSARQIGGVFAAEPHAAAALQALIPALVGLALLWAALSWLLLAAAAHGPDARTSSGKPRRVGDVTEPLLAGADCGTAAMPIVSGAGVVPQVGTTLVAGSSQGLPFLPRCPSETCVC
eukprot:XP_001692139.1 predicted protein [Chlamydomonas reinhardtii]